MDKYDSFSKIHALAYSFIGFQTAFIATEWNPIFWDAACLVVNSGALDPEAEKSTDYAKNAKAIGAIREQGVNISLININTSNYGFEPDIANNRILYGLKAVSGINEETIEKIICGRPYKGIKDFMNRCVLNKTSMINLIKAGAFDEIDEDFDSRYKIMAYYLMRVSEPKTKLNLQNFSGLISCNLVPKDLELQVRVFNFNKYLKANKKNGNYFVFDNECLAFYNKFLEDYIENLEVIQGNVCILQKTWDKIYQKLMDAAREWLQKEQQNVLKEYNNFLLTELWKKYAEGTLSSWEMDSLCFYYHEHELQNVDSNKYGLSNFKDLPSDPEVDYYFKRGGHRIPIFKLTKIAGTVLMKNDTKSTVTILTTSGVVDVKFSKEYYAMFKRQISEVGLDGKKHVIEKSWFKRGTKILVTGFRRDDTFVGKTYASTIGHQLYKIVKVEGDQIVLQHERMTSANAIEEDEYEE